MLRKCQLLWHTLRPLKPIQLYWRLWLWVSKAIPISATIPDFSVKSLSLLAPIPKHQSLHADAFTFLNQTHPCRLPMAWHNPQASKLWLYNLHYFDFINQAQVDPSFASALILDWITQNPLAKQGNGWEPYTLSLRIVNWIKFLSMTTELNRDSIKPIYASLYLQARFLRQHLEYHLLGNHLFKNAVALLFAGSFFSGSEAQQWQEQGKSILLEQVREQVLADGGHFECSPMYHILILEDILDCLNLQQTAYCIEANQAAELTNIAKRMLSFLVDILHPDGEIPFFNDAAFNIAPSPKSVVAYSTCLDITRSETSAPHGSDSPVKLIEKPDVGLYVLQNTVGRMILDLGQIGPDYLPGHAHCDTLSFELSIAGQRCIVNSGTYQYAGDLRNTFRATRAHNTVRINAQEQHEIWSTFRVARRGYVENIHLNNTLDSISVTAAHTGYQRLKGKPLHGRQVICSLAHWMVHDLIEGQGSFVAESYIHLHPAVTILTLHTDHVVCAYANTTFIIRGLDNGYFEIEEGQYSPEFGCIYPHKVLVMRKQANNCLHLSYQISPYQQKL